MPRPASVEDVGVDHGGFEAFVAEEFLDGADVLAGLQEVGGEGVAEGVAAGFFGEAGFLDGGGDGFLDDAGVQVVSVAGLVLGVVVGAGGGEEPLPGPLAGGAGELAMEGVGEGDLDVGVAFEELVGLVDLVFELGNEGAG